MSFMRTLATVAVGFAAAKGMDKYKQMGGMAGLQKMMHQGGPAGRARLDWPTCSAWPRAWASAA